MNKKNIFLLLLIMFVTQKTYADLITDNIENGCYENNISIDDNNNANLFAIFSKNNYECSVGQYLPRDTEGCRACGTEHTCPGGTYTFNENKSQGIEWMIPFKQSSENSCIGDFINIDNNSHSNLFAIFTPNQYTCSPGYYLPANVDSCTICPSGNKCIGGTYTFNETTDQGITACPNDNKYAPIGSAICYPRRARIDEGVYLHLKATPATNPSVEINVNGTIYYGNLAPTETQITQTVDRFMPVMVNGVEYFACDDTTCPVTN